MPQWFDQHGRDMRTLDEREREETASPAFRRLFLNAFAIAAIIGLLLGLVWTIAGTLAFPRITVVLDLEISMATVVADLREKTPENAKRQFVELYGAPLLLNRYLKIALMLMVLLAASLVVLNFRTQARYAHLKPLVIRISDVGRAEAVDYDATTYRPQAPELRYFLDALCGYALQSVARDGATRLSGLIVLPELRRWRTPPSRAMIARARSSCS